MHIPDGYLAPQTTIPALAAMVPLWGTALQKTKRTLSRREVPTLALFAAFCFVIMMFNIPVAGGSTAHAVGAVLAAVLMGPWEAVLAVSTALLIQALLFGDGGILAFGVNCLNMAVVMPFSGWLVYRLVAGKAMVAGKAKPGGKRSLLGVFAGSYIGINLAALCAGLELGVQPLLFKTAAGVPLYGPYPLWVSVPAMLFAHLLFAGPLEAAVSTGAYAYLARFAPSLINREGAALDGARTKKSRRALLLPLGVLALLTPMGLIAPGTAWGEWSLQELKTRLGFVPKGLAAAAEKWQAFLPDYSLPVLGGSRAGATLGYILSAAAGMAVIAGLVFLTFRLVLRFSREPEHKTGTRE